MNVPKEKQQILLKGQKTGNFAFMIHGINVVQDVDIERYMNINLGIPQPLFFLPIAETASGVAMMQGSPFQTFFSIVYLSMKYKNACIVTGRSNMMNLTIEDFHTILRSNIRFDNDLTLTSSDQNHIIMTEEMINQTKSCYTNPDIRFIIFPLSIIKRVIGHANVLIYDKISKTLERFEPHGVCAQHIFDFVKNFDKKIVKFLRDNIGMIIHDYKTPENFCPLFSYQAIEGSENVISVNTDPKGFCQSWALFYIELRLRNPNVSRQDILTNSISQIRSNFVSFRKFIRGYSYMLRKIILILNSENDKTKTIREVLKKFI